MDAYLGDPLGIYAEKELPPGSRFLGFIFFDIYLVAKEDFVYLLDCDSVTDLTFCIDAICQRCSGGFLHLLLRVWNVYQDPVTLSCRPFDMKFSRAAV